MIFTELSLTNFGAYAGTNCVVLEPADGRPVILVGGQNGEGKTTILEAIQLALYGPHSLAMNGHSGGYEHYLRSRTNHGAKDGVDVSVELTMKLAVQSGERVIRVRRSWLARGARPREMLEVFAGDVFDEQLSDGWGEFIETILPRGVAPLFFFDGERIEALADLDGAAETLRTAVGALLGLELVDRLGDDLKALERRHADKAGSAELRSELAQKDEALAGIDAELRRARERTASLATEFERARSRALAADEAFSREGGASYQARASRESKVEAAAARLEEAKSRLRDLARGVLPLALVGGLLSETSARVRADEEQALLRRVLEVLEERDRLTLSEVQRLDAARGAEHYEPLAGWFEQDRSRRSVGGRGAGSGLELTAAGLRRLIAIEEHLLPDTRSELSGARGVYTAATVELEEAEGRLAEVPTPDAIEGLISERERAKAELERCAAELSEFEEAVDLLERRQERARDDRDRTMKRAAEEGLAVEDSQRVLVHSERVRKTLAVLRERAAEHHMARIEKLIADSLRSLLRKRSLVHEVRIDPTTYGLSLIGAEGRQIETSQLSAGERQLTALALLWGLARAASRSLPVIIDTPLARLDAAHRQLFVGAYLPAASHQVMVLSTDTEIDESLHGRLEKDLARTYRLVHDDAAGRTRVEDGYFFDQSEKELAAA